MIQSTTHEMAAWLALSRCPGIGHAAFAMLKKTFPQLNDLFLCSSKDLQALSLNEAALAYLAKPDWQAIEKELKWAEENDQHIIKLTDSDYPAPLKEIPAAPPLLFIKGNKNILHTPQLAIVGSRNPTPDGQDIAYQFAHYLAQNNICITSGLAIGIDTKSHQGALDAQGKTIAILGTGIDTIYPFRNKSLAKKIEQNGALVSEFPLGTPVKSTNFPQRNRIISGLSVGVLVVEASLRSGSLITARYALEQGREIFAIPSSIHNPLAKGCHALIRQGAKLVETVEHIVEELNGIRLTKSILPQQITLKLEQQLDKQQQKLVKCMGYRAINADMLAERTGFSIKTISTMLPILEMQGVIKSVSGGYAKVKYSPTC